jgi:hypothetical protein
VIDLCTIPLTPERSFSCELEKFLWMVRHTEEHLVRIYWTAYEFAQKGRSFERVLFEIEHNPDLWDPSQGAPDS